MLQKLNRIGTLAAWGVTGAAALIYGTLIFAMFVSEAAGPLPLRVLISLFISVVGGGMAAASAASLIFLPIMCVTGVYHQYTRAFGRIEEHVTLSVLGVLGTLVAIMSGMAIAQGCVMNGRFGGPDIADISALPVIGLTVAAMTVLLACAFAVCVPLGVQLRRDPTMWTRVIENHR